MGCEQKSEMVITVPLDRTGSRTGLGRRIERRRSRKPRCAARRRGPAGVQRRDHRGHARSQSDSGENGVIRASSMDPNWNDNQPIYRQLRDRVVEMILEGVLGDGDALPSVRNVAAEYRLNPLTVLKGYQELVDEELVEKRRGRGMFVREGAKRNLLKDERQLFLQQQWPAVVATIGRLGLDLEELLAKAKAQLEKHGEESE